jgi:subtilisin family serine protease
LRKSVKRFFLVSWLAFLWVLWPVARAPDNPQKHPYAVLTSGLLNLPAQDCQVLVRFKGSLPAQNGSMLLAHSGLQSAELIPELNIWRAGCVAQGLQASLDILKQDPRVAWVEPNGFVHAHAGSPDDPFFPENQPNLLLIHAPQAWDRTHGDDKPVAIVDTGVDLNHPDLENKIWVNPAEIPGNGVDDDGNGYIDDVQGWNFVGNNSDVQDDSGHGSHVAGIIAAQTDNAVGIAGISWLARIMPLKALNGANTGTFADVAQAIVYAADNGARVINLSLGTDQPSATLEAAVYYASQKGCLLVASAGNTGAAVEYPAAYAHVLAVAATTNADLPASFSSRGPQIDLAAPGVDIFSADNRGFYYFASGTSASAPQVSAVAALIWSVRPDLAADQVSAALEASAHDVWTPGWDELTGFGRLDAQAAIQVVAPIQVKIYAPLFLGQAEPARIRLFLPVMALRE